MAAAWLALAGSAHAAHPLITDDTGTQGTGHWQFEANTDHTRVRDGGVTQRELGANATLTYGLTETLDIAANLPWQRFSSTGVPSVSGVADATVQAKWRFYENGQGWSLGVRPALTLPTGSESKGLGNGRSTASVALLSNLESGPWTWLANAGYTYNANKLGDRKNLWSASTAVLYKLSEQWTLAADVGLSRAAEQGARSEKYGLLGAIYHANDDLDLDFGWRRSLGGSPTAHTLGVGVTVRW